MRQIFQRNHQGIRNLIFILDAPAREEFQPDFPITGTETGKFIRKVTARVPFVSVVTDGRIVNNIRAICIKAVKISRDISGRVLN